MARAIRCACRLEFLLAFYPQVGQVPVFSTPPWLRNYRRGVLTSFCPITSVDERPGGWLGRRTGTAFAAALYGLLTPPERSDVRGHPLRGCRPPVCLAGTIAERSFSDAIAQREIGCWVSTRPLFIQMGSRFQTGLPVRWPVHPRVFQEQGVEIPPIACFTAPQTRVQEEVLAFFKPRRPGIEILWRWRRTRTCFFEVQPAPVPASSNACTTCSRRLPRPAWKCIVFRATRQTRRSP